MYYLQYSIILRRKKAYFITDVSLYDNPHLEVHLSRQN